LYIQFSQASVKPGWAPAEVPCDDPLKTAFGPAAISGETIREDCQ
jgi:hypothetical protein